MHRRRSEDIYQPGTTVDIMDDHVRLNVGVPAVDLIDHRYGPNATGFANSYWHTLEDTPDKVSADALETVMHLVELGLRSGAWMDAVNADGDFTDGPSGEEDPSPPSTSARPRRADRLAGAGLDFRLGVGRMQHRGHPCLRSSDPRPQQGLGRGMRPK